jgi:hypothetical protein
VSHSRIWGSLLFDLYAPFAILKPKNRKTGIMAGMSRLIMGISPTKKKGVFVCLIPLDVEQSWQGDFLFLARNFLWMHYAGAENRKGAEESY